MQMQNKKASSIPYPRIPPLLTAKICPEFPEVIRQKVTGFFCKEELTVSQVKSGSVNSSFSQFVWSTARSSLLRSSSILPKQ